MQFPNGSPFQPNIYLRPFWRYSATNIGLSESRPWPWRHRLREHLIIPFAVNVPL